MSEPLLVVEEGGEVGDEDDEDGGHVDRHEVAEDVPLEDHLDGDPLHVLGEESVGDAVGLEVVPGGRRRSLGSSQGLRSFLQPVVYIFGSNKSADTGPLKLLS